MNKLFVGIIALVLTSCASICTIDSFTVSTESKLITIEKSEFTCKKKDDFIKAATLTVQAVFSERFEEELTRYINDSVGEGAHKAAWQGLEASQVIASMKSQINGTYVETYGGIKGLWLNIFYGNIAYDGTDVGPIRYNRIPLRKRTTSQIANTLGHELAHRVGLKHPSSDKNLKIAHKEPPYVIGNMIGKIVKTINKSS